MLEPEGAWPRIAHPVQPSEITLTLPCVCLLHPVAAFPTVVFSAVTGFTPFKEGDFLVQLEAFRDKARFCCLLLVVVPCHKDLCL